MKTEIGDKLPDAQQKEVVFTKLILEAAKANEIDVYTSILTVVECLHVDGRMDNTVKDNFSALLTSGQYVKLISPTPFTAERARDLKWKDGINIPGRGADYLHVASALEVGCTEFLTGDSRGIHKEKSKLAVMGLRVVAPSDTSALTDERRQVDLLKTPVVGIADAKRKKASSRKRKARR